VTNRGEVVCLDTEGFYDGEDDGPRKAFWGNLLREPSLLNTVLKADRLPDALAAILEEHGVNLNGRRRVKSAGIPHWLLSIRSQSEETTFRIRPDAEQLVVEPWSVDEEKVDGPPLITVPNDLAAGLDRGNIAETTLALIGKRGMPITGEPQVEVIEPGQKWSVMASVNGKNRQLEIRREGANLSVYKLITVDDKCEADEIWVFDMMGELGISQHNMANCSMTTANGMLFVCTSNGTDETHCIPAPDAPSFMAMDRETGKVIWTDNSPGNNILHAQWASPSYGVFDGQPQVIFPGGDGWVYSFDPKGNGNGGSKLLWKFDANPKISKWNNGG
jgi:hypothetical protein